MTSRAKLKAALRAVKDGLSRARANNFGKSGTELRQRRKALVRALRTVERRPCGARRRSDGKPCQALNEPGKTRCKWHGGHSTGPRTASGKLRALANLKQYARQRCN